MKFSCTLLASFILLNRLTALSAAEETAPEAPVAAKGAERIQVTGSRIRQIDTEGPKPVVSIGRHEIEQSGAKDVNEILSKMTLSSFGSDSYGGNYGAPEGTQSLDLRGLGSGNTLVLLNGRRIVRDPSIEFVDLSVIPSVAVERIEIVKGTASAIYGTDALSGVVNIITRKDFEGLSFGVSKTIARFKGGDRSEGYVISGTQSQRSSNVLTVQWNESTSILGGDRPWADTTYRSRYGFPFAYQTQAQNADGENVFAPAAACDDSRSDSKGVGCTFDYWDQYQLQGNWQKLSALDDFSYELTDDTTLNLRLFVTNKTSKSRGLPEVLDSAQDAYTVSEAAVGAKRPDLLAAGNQAPLFAPDAAQGNQNGVLVDGRFPTALSRTYTDQLSYSSYLGLSHSLASGQILEFGVSDSRTKRTHIWQDQFDDRKLRDAVFDGTVDVLSPLANQDLSLYQLDVPDLFSSTSQSAEASLTGEFALLEKRIGYSLGVSHIREAYLNRASLNKLNSQIKQLGGGGGQGERKANAVFGELSVPILPGLDTSLAARMDDYSDFGSTFNPMLGLQYRFDGWLYTRLNYGTGFKAPTLRNLHDQEARYFTSFTDYRQCNEATAANIPGDITKYCEQERSAEVRSGGNRELKPETSTSLNLFVGIEPIAGTGISFEFFQSQVKDVIKEVLSEDLMQIEAQGRPLPVGTEIIRSAQSNEVIEIVSPTTNLSTIQASGLDTSLYTRQTFGWARVSLRSDYSYYLSYKEQKIPGGAYEQKLEENGKPRYRWNNTFGLGWGKQDVSLTSNTFGRYQKANRIKGYVGSYTNWDLNYSYALTESFDFQVGGNDIFNQPFPKDDSDNIFGDVGGDFYPVIGPTVYTRLNYTM